MKTVNASGGRLLLLATGATSATTEAVFGSDSELTATSVRALRTAIASRPGPLAATARGAVQQICCGPEYGTRQTAALASGVGSATTDSRIADWGHGRWHGRSLESVQHSEPEALVRWLTEPDFDGHGGESLRAFSERIHRWLLQALVEAPDRRLVVAMPAVIRAAVAVTMGGPVGSFWNVEAPPLSMTELRARDRRWTLRYCGLGMSAAPPTD